MPAVAKEGLKKDAVERNENQNLLGQV